MDAFEKLVKLSVLYARWNEKVKQIETKVSRFELSSGDALDLLKKESAKVDKKVKIIMRDDEQFMKDRMLEESYGRI